MKASSYEVKEGTKIDLRDFPTDEASKTADREASELLMEDNLARMIELQDRLYAGRSKSLLLIFQGMDASGKDGAIKHLMSGLNPQGTRVTSFKEPSQEELEHDFLWRIEKNLPPKGTIGIFNRSHYEDVLIVRVHNLLNDAMKKRGESLWKQRYSEIKNFEKYLNKNDTVILKFFLNISKKEQTKRFLSRLDDGTKNWKFTSSDLEERKYWERYREAYEDAITATSTKNSPWYIVPADTKWYGRLVISNIIIKSMEGMNLKYPELDAAGREKISSYRSILLKEK